MSVTELAIKRPILFIVFFLTLAGGALFAWSGLKYELLPELSTPFVSVFTVYPGASPAEVETAVTKKIEDGVSRVGMIKRVTSFSRTGLSWVLIEFRQTANQQIAVTDVQRAVSQVTLPTGARTPMLEKISLQDFPVLRLAVTADHESDLYRLMTDQVQPRLAQLPGVGRVTLMGGAEREIKVLVDDQRLQHYQLSLLQVVEMLRRADLDVPVGQLPDHDAEFEVRLPGKVATAAELENQVVAVAPDGSQVRLRDVARVIEGHQEERVLARLNARPAIGVAIQKQTGSNAVEVSRLVRAELTKLENDYGDRGLRFEVAQDASEFTLHAANATFTDFFLAIGLVALVMLVFLHSWRNALVVMLAIPSSLTAALIMMWLADYSLNLMTLLAMSLVIGILVDDSIVVLENIYRHLEMGKPRRLAALEGRNEIGFSALSITLVDVVVFLPMAFVSGLVGSLIREFSLVIVVSTLASLVVSFTLTPMLASRFARLEHLTGKTFFGRLGLWFERQIDHLTDFYQRLLVWSLRHRWTVRLVSLGLLIGSFGLIGAGFIGGEFVPMTDKGEMQMSLTLPTGTRLEDADALVKRVERRLRTLPEVTRVYTTVGFQADGYNEITSPHVADLSIALVPAHQRTRSVKEVARAARALALAEPGLKARVQPIGILGANDAPIQILVSGPNRAHVLQAGAALLAVVKQVPGTLGPRLSLQDLKPEARVQLDRRKLADLGLDIENVGFTLRTALTGYDELKFREMGQEVPIRVQLAGANREQTEQLQDLSFVNRAGQVIKLRQFATVENGTAPGLLERRNRNPSVLLLSQVVGRPSGDVGADIQKAVEKLKLPADVRLSYEGDLEMQDDSFGSLGLALLASILLVYLIMVALYNSWVYPFVVLFSVPVALVGALLALALTAKTLNIFSIFGLIMLVGLVSKNAILLVDRANQVRTEGRSVLYAILEAGRTRLRPILMTTLAMVIGMLPLALGTGAGSELNAPLAWVLIGGLSSSMFLTLLLVPTIYYSVARRLDGRPKQKGHADPAVKTPLAPVKRAVQVAVAGLALLLFAANAQAQPTAAKRISVAEAVNLGLANHPQIHLAELETQRAEQRAKEAAGLRLPTVSAGGTYTRNLKAPVFFFPQVGVDPNTGGLLLGDKLVPIRAAANNAWGGNVTVEMPLFNGQIASGIAAARAGQTAAAAQTATARAELAAGIRNAYYGVLIAQAGGRLTEETLRRADQALAETRSLFRRGMAADADTLRAFVARENVRPSLSRSQAAVRTATLQLTHLMGLDETTSFELADSLTYQSQPLPDVADATEQAQARRPELAQLRAQQVAAQAMTRAEKGRFLPSLGLASQLQVQDQANDFRFSNYRWPVSSYVGVQLSVPIFNGFRTQARVQQALIQERQVEQQLVQQARQLRVEVALAHAALTEAHKRVEMQATTIRAAARSYQLTQRRYQQGIARFADLSDAELALRQAQTNRLQAIYDYLVAQTEYARAAGQL